MGIEIKCEVCGGITQINGKCKNCGWVRSRDGVLYPNAANPPNFYSLNEAKERYAAGKKLIPDYTRLIELLSRGLAISFKYQGKRYQIDMHEDYTLWETETEDNYWSYSDIDDLRENLAIDGVKLRVVWDTVRAIRYEC